MSIFMENVAKNNKNIGSIFMLYSKSALHSTWPVAIAMGYISPAILKEQFLMIFDAKNIPVAYASWAFLDLKNECKYINDPHSLGVDDWCSGDRLWLMDFLSPFSGEVTKELFRLLTSDIFPNHVARSLRLKPDSGVAYIKSYGGKAISQDEKMVTLKRYYDELRKASLIYDFSKKIIF
jgi:cytolysin-activating lysine-acyltransferase